MGSYKWQTYGEVENRAMNFGSGLSFLGHRRGEKIVFYAETRAEWMIGIIACFKFGYPGKEIIREDSCLSLVFSGHCVRYSGRRCHCASHKRNPCWLDSGFAGIDSERSGKRLGSFCFMRDQCFLECSSALQFVETIGLYGISYPRR